MADKTKKSDKKAPTTPGGIGDMFRKLIPGQRAKDMILDTAGKVDATGKKVKTK
jgi:hypothetical protein